jgi:hypothetical protein
VQELLKRPHTPPMDLTGRPLKGFVFVEAPGLRTDRQRRKWVTMARTFTGSLPAKPRKAAAKRERSRRATSPSSTRR